MNKVSLLLTFMLFNYFLYANDYYTYNEIVDSLYAWQDQFGGSNQHMSSFYSNNNFGVIYNLDSIGYSSQDSLTIYAVKLSANVNENEPKPKVLILGQCHAEEIYGVEIAMEIINQFLHPNQYIDNKTFLEIGLGSTELWIIPTYNPDGLKVVHGYFEGGNEIKDVTYRKNKRDTNHNDTFDHVVGIGKDIDGVDLNRNYDFNWIFGDTWLQSCDPVVSDCSYDDDYDYYKGEYPESESEVQAIVNIAKEQNFLLSIAYHSSRSGNVDKIVVYPWAWEDKSTIVESPGYNVIEMLGDEMAELLSYSYSGGSKSRRGNAQDWFYRETGCIQYLIEVGYTDDASYGEGLLIESDHLLEVVESNIDGFFHLLMRAAGQRYVNEFIDMEFNGGNQVQGIVTDASTGLPIVEAIINIPELEGDVLKSRKTDSFGYYCRLTYPGNSYNMKVSAYGYTAFDTIITPSAGNPTKIDIGLIPVDSSRLTFNIQTPDEVNTNLQLIIQNSFRSDTLFITYGESINLPHDYYRLVLYATGYIPQVIDIDLVENIVLSRTLMYEHIIWEEHLNSSVSSNIGGETNELSIPLSSVTTGDSIIIEMNYRHELEWDYDYFIIDYINEGNTTEIMKITGDDNKYNTEYIPFTIPEGYSDGRLYLHLDRDDTWNNKYRGVQVKYIKIMKGSEIPLANATGILDVLPGKIQLYQNYPNPFNPSTNINFQVPFMASVSISIFNIRGEFIEQLVKDMYEPGHYSIIFPAEDYASGIYLYQLKTENSVYTKKFIILK